MCTQTLYTEHSGSVNANWIKIKWGPENMYTFSIVGHIENVNKFSGPHSDSNRGKAMGS